MVSTSSFSEIFDLTSDFQLLEKSLYIYGLSAEDRSNITIEFEESNPTVKFINIEKTFKEDYISINGSGKKIALRNFTELNKHIDIEYKTIYLDVTGLDNRVCAPLLKLLCERVKNNNEFSLFILYKEPKLYNVKKFKNEAVFSNLSEKIDGIYPLPGFASIFPDNDSSCLVAFLGFEGSRFMHILENVECSTEKIYPIIGLPGFRAEYPHIAFWGNKKPLEETGSWKNVRYAKANSISDAYNILIEILKTTRSSRIKVAPIGTKPHAIGVILASILNPSKFEIVYDNPIRKIKRTEGFGKIVVCSISDLVRNSQWA